MWRLAGAKLKDRYYVGLSVDAVRATREMAPGAIRPLDVEWEPIGDERRDEPGADGHAGISGLDEGSCPNRRQRRAIRSPLKDLAESTLTHIGS